MNNTELIQVALTLWGAVFSAIAAAVVFLGRSGQEDRSIPLTVMLEIDCLMMIGDSLSFIFKGNVTSIAWIMTRVGNMLVFICVPMLVFAMTVYIYCISGTKLQKSNIGWLVCCGAVCTIHFLMVVVSQFTDFLYYFDENNIYHRTDKFVIAAVLGAIEILILAAMTFRYRKQISVYERYAITAYLLLPFVSNVIQAFHYGLILNDVAVTVCLLCVFMNHEIQKSRLLVQREKELLEHRIAMTEQQAILSKQEAELAQKRLQISISQMGPHFAFNTLGSIEQLCKTDPQKAAEATHYFAQYMRRNVQSLSSTELVPFRDEMGHVRTYVWLEKMRFGEDVEFQENITVDSFKIPSLTVQPLVENSIKHGMMGMEEGTLTVSVATEETETCYRIIVTDDGCGFDSQHPSLNHPGHIGLSNVRERLRMMTGGSLEISSEPGKGATVVIEIPKKQ